MINNRKLKILHFIYDHPDNPWVGGGGALRTWTVNKYLSNRHEICVFCGSFPGAIRKDEPFEVLFAGKAKNYFDSRIKYILYARRLDFQRYDLIVEDFSFYSPVIHNNRNRPLITIAHSNQGLKALKFHPLLGLISLFSQYLILSRRRYVVIVANHIKSAVYPAVLTEVIGQGVDIPANLPPSSEEFVLFLGRLDIKVKGLDILIDAWSQLPGENSNLSLIIAGGGDKAKIEDLIKKKGAKNIKLVGHLNHSEALSMIRKAAFLCIPSRMEGSPLVAYESLALGKPVIGTSIPALKDIIPHDIAGILVPPENAIALRGAIESLINNSSKRSILAQGALEEGKKFSWERVAERQENFYIKVLNRQKVDME